MLQLQVLAYDDIYRTLSQMRNNVVSVWIYTWQKAKDDCSLLRQLEIYVLLLNKVHEHVVFTSKMTCIVIGTVTGYAAIACFQQHNAMFGIMYLLMFCDCGSAYAVVYGKAFAVPRCFREVIQAIKERIGVDQPRGARREAMERQIMSVPLMGIKVGSFHTLERTSTPVFIDFVMKNVVSMLVIYS